MDYQPSTSLDDLIAKLGVMIQSFNQGQKYVTDKKTPVPRPPPPCNLISLVTFYQTKKEISDDISVDSADI